MKILIVGNNAAALALVKKLGRCDYVEKIFITGTGTDDVKVVDIREDDLMALLMFVHENKIDLTIPVSEKALGADIVSFFQSNGQNIFGPSKDSCDFVLNKILCKKLLYKINAPIPKFGMFNKAVQIFEYLKKANFPVVIRTSQNSYMDDDKMFCSTFKSAYDFTDRLFLKGETDVLVEEYVFGHSFTVYFVTDGYGALPINIVSNYKFLDENGGLYTDGVGCYCPDYKIDSAILSRVENILFDILSNLDLKGSPYLGVIGLECVLIDKDNFIVQDIKPFFQNHDSSAVLNLCEDDLLKIFISCINGFFSDDYKQIKTSDSSSLSLSIYSDRENSEINFVEGIEDIDFINVKYKHGKYYSNIGMNFTLTKTSATLSRAKQCLKQELEDIKFNGMKYLKDVLISSETYFE